MIAVWLQQFSFVCFITLPVAKFQKFQKVLWSLLRAPTSQTSYTGSLFIIKFSMRSFHFMFHWTSFQKNLSNSIHAYVLSWYLNSSSEIYLLVYPTRKSKHTILSVIFLISEIHAIWNTLAFEHKHSHILTSAKFCSLDLFFFISHSVLPPSMILLCINISITLCII